MSDLENEFGKAVCESLGINPEIVRLVVIESYPGDDLTITLEISASSDEALAWARSENIKNPGKVVLMEIDDGQMV